MEEGLAPNPRAGRPASSGDVGFGATVKRAPRSEDLDVVEVEVEMLVIQAVDMVVASEKIDAGAKQDSAWLWAEPELVSQVPTTSEESAIAVQDGPELGRVRCVGVRRQAGVQPCARGPLDLQSLGGLAEGYWTSPKPVGLTRVRCDRQHGRPLPPPPPTPGRSEVHAHAIGQPLDTCCLDMQRAFLHAPGVDRVFTAPPGGFERRPSREAPAEGLRSQERTTGVHRVVGDSVVSARVDPSQCVSTHFFSPGIRGPSERVSMT